MSKQNQPARRSERPIHRKFTIESEGENDEFRGLEAHQIERILAIYNRRGPATLDRTRREAAEHELNDGIQAWLGDDFSGSGSPVRNALDLVAVHLAGERQLDSFVKTTSRFLQLALFSHAFALKCADAPDAKVELAFYQIELCRYLFKTAIEPAVVKLASLGSRSAEILRKLNEYLAWYTASTLNPILEFDPAAIAKIPLRVDSQSRRHFLGAARRKIQEKPTILGQNLHRLRCECDWTIDDFVMASDIPRSTILTHINDGVAPHPGTLQEYASAFTEKLGRDVTVAELLSPLSALPIKLD